LGVALPVAGQRALDAAGVRAHAEGVLDRAGQPRRPQLRVGGQLLLGPRADLVGELVAAARPGPGGGQAFQPRRLQRGGRGVVRGPGVPERRGGLGDRGAAGPDLAHHLVLDLHRVAGVEELAGQELRVGHLLRVRVQAPRSGQRGLLGIAVAALRDHVQIAVCAYEHGIVRPGHATPPADRKTRP
jgi:hypothetical protein